MHGTSSRVRAAPALLTDIDEQVSCSTAETACSAACALHLLMPPLRVVLLVCPYSKGLTQCCKAAQPSAAHCSCFLAVGSLSFYSTAACCHRKALSSTCCLLQADCWRWRFYDRLPAVTDMPFHALPIASSLLRRTFRVGLSAVTRKPFRTLHVYSKQTADKHFLCQAVCFHKTAR